VIKLGENMNNKMNLLVHMNGYSDQKANTEPSLNNFKWNREYIGIDIKDPLSESISLAPGASKLLFSGGISTSADSTTTFDIFLRENTTSSYILAHNSGTAPLFRIPRISGADATTEVTVTKNAKLMKFESTGGTLFDLIVNGVVVGDRIRIGDAFNSANIGQFTIIALTATSFTVVNETGSNESNIVLGADFKDQIDIYSSSGVQVGDKITIKNGFSPVSFGSYEITDVSHDFIEFHSLNSLPEEYGVSNNPEAISIYRSSKQFVYIEANRSLNIKINGSTITNTIEPFNVGTSVRPGIFLSKSNLSSIEIENPTTEECSVVYITAE